jgi:hypothetical protein
LGNRLSNWCCIKIAPSRSGKTPRARSGPCEVLETTAVGLPAAVLAGDDPVWVPHPPVSTDSPRTDTTITFTDRGRCLAPHQCEKGSGVLKVMARRPLRDSSRATDSASSSPPC